MTCFGNPRIYFLCRKVSALTRFCALCHLDLDFSCRYKITACYPKSATGNLFDCGTAVILASGRSNTFCTLSTFTCIGFTMQMVHCDCKCLMCFLRNRSIGHCTCLESFYDFIHTLDFFDRDCLFRIIKLQKTSECTMAFFICQRCILFEKIVASGPRRLLQKMDRLWIVTMFLSLTSHFMCADTVQCKVCIKT